jgi:hypothetical protein
MRLPEIGLRAATQRRARERRATASPKHETPPGRQHEPETES